MCRAARTSLAVVCGFAAGLAIGPISLLAASASDRWMRGWNWPELDSKYALLLLVTSLPAATNGAIGAALAAAVGNRKRLGITLLPGAIHVVAGIWSLVELQSFLLLQLISLMFSVVVWPAGRLGQLIGWAIHSPSPEPVAPSEPIHQPVNE